MAGTMFLRVDDDDPSMIADTCYHELDIITRFPSLIGEMFRAEKADLHKSEDVSKIQKARRKALLKLLNINATDSESKESHKYCLMKAGKQYIVSRFEAYSLVETDEALPICPDEFAFTFLDVEKQIGDLCTKCRNEIEVPPVKLLEAYVKRCNKDAVKLKYLFGLDMPTVSVSILINALKVMPSMKLFWYGNIQTATLKNGDLEKQALEPL